MVSSLVNNKKCCLKRLVAAILVFEFCVTSLGFCGHDHDHGKTIDISSHDDNSSWVNLSPEHQFPHSHEHNEKNQNVKLNCSCLGGFIAEQENPFHEIIVPFKSFKFEFIHRYSYLYIPFIYHPPIN
jgi:hypothetical protein